MHAALAVSFGLIAVAPFIGRWRANVWLQARTPVREAMAPNNVIEIA